MRGNRSRPGGAPAWRRASARFALALCAALLAAVGLGGAAAPAFGAGSTPVGGGFGATQTPATARVVASAASGGTANRVRPVSQHENSKPVTVTQHRTHPDGLPVAVVAVRLGFAEPLLPAGRALTSAPARAPPAPAGLPDTRAPPTSGRS